MVLVVMFLCDQSYASHGRDFLLGATILNFNVSDKESRYIDASEEPT